MPSDCDRSAAHPQPESHVPATTGHVLVVDDEAPNRALIADWLGAYGHRVTTACDGLEALQFLAHELPDVIILDVMMPGLDGFAVCEQLKTDPRTAGVPILLHTALSEREDRLRGMRVGANDFLIKPADLPYVLLRVRNAIRVRRMHLELEERLRQVTREQQLRESLLHMIVHDLRTPLAGLEGFLQLLQMTAGAKLEERPTHYLRQAMTATHRLANQIDLLLDIHRMEDGRMPVMIEPLELPRIIQQALDPLRPLFGQRRLRIDMPADSVTAMGDANLLVRVVANLVGNAIAFTSPQQGEISVRALRHEGRARVEIEDNGPGIDPSKQEAIFEKFYQVGEQVRNRSSGLGLAFCKLAMAAQSGRIGVTSRPGAGSRFWFELPIATTAAVDPAA